ncbi:MAG: ATP-binding cassette domain-containing protein, partial [Bacteroidota bacterium]
GRHKPDVGTIATSEGVTIGYLPQEIKFTSNRTVIEETRTIFEEEQRIEKAIAAINTEMGEREDYESEGYLKLINQLTELHERQHVLNASKTEGQLERVLKGLGFSTTDFERPIKEFSGGWQMRVDLAKLLILRPTLLLLDEPTNHLDIESILWLEDFFKNYPGALMMISHDRMFLDQVTNRTIEIIFGRIYDYKVPYTRYMVLREERYQQQLSTYKNQQKYIAQQERFIERFRAKATKAKQVQSKQKQLDKLERVSFDEMDQQSIQFRFPAAPRSGDVVLRSKQLGKRYGDLTVLRDLNFEITRGEKVAFVGKNGEGKSTLVKMINGEDLTSGELILGHNVDIGYYAQVQENTLDQEVSVLDTIENAATDEWRNIS